VKTLPLSLASAAATACLAITSCKEDKEKDLQIKALETQSQNLKEENHTLQDELAKLEKQNNPEELERLRMEISELNRQIGKLETIAADRDKLAAELEILRAKASAAPPPEPPKPEPAIATNTAETMPDNTPAANSICDSEGKVKADISNAVVIIEGDSSVGTGFIAKEGDHVYLYTAAHVLSGNSKLTVKNAVGKSFTKFDGIEVAEDADLVRLKLAEPYDQPLLVASADEDVRIQVPIAALGNGGGQGVVSMEKGEILGTSDGSIEISAAVIQGNSGGPLLISSNSHVVGVITHLTARRNDLWSEGTRQGDVRRFACRINTARKWSAMSPAVFLKDGKAVSTYDETTLLGFAVAMLQPTVSGLRYSGMQYGEKTPLAIIERNKDNPSVIELRKFNSDLQSGKVRYGMTDLRKKTSAIVASMRSKLDTSKQSLLPEKLNPYHRSLAEESIKARIKAIDSLDSLINRLQ
jgi:serine protease Do